MLAAPQFTGSFHAWGCCGLLELSFSWALKEEEEKLSEAGQSLCHMAWLSGSVLGLT